MKVTKDFEELFEYFNAESVRALIVGAHALAFHGKPRYTKDIDVLVDPTHQNAERIMKALERFGFGDIGLSASDFTKLGQIIQLGVAPNRIDLLTEIGGTTFDEAWASRIEGPYGGQRVFYLGKKLLIRSKRAAGRPQDLADVEWLEGQAQGDE